MSHQTHRKHKGIIGAVVIDDRDEPIQLLNLRAVRLVGPKKLPGAIRDDLPQRVASVQELVLRRELKQTKKCVTWGSYGTSGVRVAEWVEC